MAVSHDGAYGTFNSKKFHSALRDVFAGTICSVLSIAYCLSYAALIFTGPLANALSYGVAVTFLSAAIGGAIVAGRSSLPFAVAGPDSSVSVVIAALVATLVHRLVTHGGTALLMPTLIAMSGDAAHGAAALHPRFHACGTRRPFRTVSGHRRFSRSHRLADDNGRGAGSN